MKKQKIVFVVLISFLFSMTSCKKDNAEDNNPEQEVPEKIYQASLINPTMDELQNFYDGKYNVINGNVEFSEVDGLLNMLALSNVKSIKGSLVLDGNYELSTLDGLNKLEEIRGDLNIISNYKIESINGLENLNYIGGDFSIRYTTKLKELTGLNKLLTIGGDLVIRSNSILVDFYGLENLQTVGGDVHFGENDNINFNGLNNIHTVKGNLSIGFGNSSLESLNGLNNIETIGGDLNIFSNELLTDLCAIRDILTDHGVEGTISITNNAYNPSVNDIINGYCSQ